MLKLTRNQKEEIYKWIENLNDACTDELNDSIEVEDFGASTTSSCEGIIEAELSALGNIIGIDLSDLDTTRSVEDIFNTFSDIDIIRDLDKIEELDEVEVIFDSQREPKYLYKDYIIKHIPSNTFHKFCMQTQGDVDISCEYLGEVIKKEVVTTIWE